MLKVNDYFAGKVKSIGFDAASTGRASVGVMEAGSTPLPPASRKK
ncbi:Pyrimidine/purine nucleoside phosphorylase [Sodalis praecaptivus]